MSQPLRHLVQRLHLLARGFARGLQRVIFIGPCRDESAAYSKTNSSSSPPSGSKADVVALFDVVPNSDPDQCGVAGMCVVQRRSSSPHRLHQRYDGSADCFR
jgi:hypothetical protein